MVSGVTEVALRDKACPMGKLDSVGGWWGLQDSSLHFLSTLPCCSASGFTCPSHSEATSPGGHSWSCSFSRLGPKSQYHYFRDCKAHSTHRTAAILGSGKSRKKNLPFQSSIILKRSPRTTNSFLGLCHGLTGPVCVLTDIFEDIPLIIYKL